MRCLIKGGLQLQYGGSLLSFIMLFALCCTALHCTALHCTSLHCTAPHCTAMQCIALHCSALHCMLVFMCFDRCRNPKQATGGHKTCWGPNKVSPLGTEVLRALKRSFLVKGRFYKKIFFKPEISFFVIATKYFSIRLHGAVRGSGQRLFPPRRFLPLHQPPENDLT